MPTTQSRLEQFGIDLYLVTTRADWKVLRWSEPRFKQLGKKPQSTGRCQLLPLTSKHEAAIVFYVNMDDVVADHSHSNVKELINTCAHEATHGTKFVLEVIGQYAYGVDEVSAYLTGWFTAWLFENSHEEPDQL